MREFSIPAPPADLVAVKDWQGTIWQRDEYDEDLFTHQFPDAYTPTYRTWWELIEAGPLTECRPATFTLNEILDYITPTHNDNN